MTTPELYLLPVPQVDRADLEPVTHLLAALKHIAKTPCTAAKDADERRELIYCAAASSLANTYPEAQQTAVYDRHAYRYPQLSTAQQRTATLALYGMACDRTSGTRSRDGHAWAAAAIAAIETYRNRPITSISGRGA